MDDVGDTLAQLAKGAGIVFIGTVVGKFFSLFAQVFIVRSLPPTEYGTLVLGFTIVSALSSLLVLGAPPGITRTLAAGSNVQRRTEILRSAVLIAVISGVVGAIGIYVFRFDIQNVTDTPGLARILTLFSLFLVISPLSKVLVGGLRGLKRPAAAVLSRDIVGRISALSLFVGFLYADKPSLGAVAYWLAIPILTLVVAAYFLNDSIPLAKTIHHLPVRSELQEFLSYSWPLALSGSFVLLMSQLDVLLIGVFLQPQDVGLYRAIQPLKEVVLFFLSAFTFLYLPIATEYFTNRELDDLDVLYTTTTKWIVTATFPVVLTSILFARDLIQGLFTVQYLPASTAFVILIVGMFSRVLVGPNGATIQAIDETRTEMYAAGLGGVSNLLFNLYLIPQFGIEGAAAATGIGFVVYNLVELAVIYSKTRITPFSLNIVKPIFPTLVVGSILQQILVEEKLGLLTIAGVGLILSVAHLSSVIVTRSVDRGDEIILQQLEGKINIELSSWLLQDRTE